MKKIIQLDEQTKNKIAAGEVVERPVSVVKEMIENSIDAYALNIEVDILDGGTSLIRVKDDGEGITKEDIPLAFTRYATSKIKNFNDLFELKSFGFRGEALASIASISQIEIETATENDNKTTIYVINHQTSGYSTEKPYRKGTSISVKHLFYNVPVRKKFLSSINKEFSLIYDLLMKYSIEFPNINFTLTHQNELIYTSRGYQSRKDLFLKNFGFALNNKILEFTNLRISNKIGLNALLAQESVNKPSKQYEIFFINGRLIKSKHLESIIEEAYYTLIPKGRFPLVYLSFTIPSEELDINVHPNKKEVKIHGINLWRDDLITLLKEALWNANLANYQYKDNYKIVEAKNNKALDSLQPITLDEIKPDNNYTYQANDSTKPQLESFYKETLKNAPLQISKSQVESRCESLQPTQQVKDSSVEVLTKDNLPSLEIIGQLNNTFILAQNLDGLYIIDQHTCHERILYERLMKKHSKSKNFTQMLLIPEKISLTPIQQETLLRHILTLRQLGFILEEKDSSTWLIHGIPKALGKTDSIESYVSDLLDRLEKITNFDNSRLIEEILTTASCKGAVKANWKLTHEDIIYLLRELETSDNPHTCPHGRPIIFKISMQELYTIFERGYYKKLK